MTKTQGWIIVGVLIIALLFGAAVYFPSTAQSSTFTVYPVGCADWYTGNTETPPAVQDFSNCHKPEAMERQIFTVDTSKNQVIETSPDGSQVINLNDCTIQDAQHWSCGSGDFSQMPGGILGATQVSRSGDNFNEYGLSAVIFVTEAQWDSINGGQITPF